MERRWSRRDATAGEAEQLRDVRPGRLVDAYPEASDARVRIQVDSVEEPTGDVAELLATARRGLAKHSIDLTTNIITP